MFPRNQLLLPPPLPQPQPQLQLQPQPQRRSRRQFAENLLPHRTENLPLQLELSQLVQSKMWGADAIADADRLGQRSGLTGDVVVVKLPEAVMNPAASLDVVADLIAGDLVVADWGAEVFHRRSVPEVLQPTVLDIRFCNGLPPPAQPQTLLKLNQQLRCYRQNQTLPRESIFKRLSSLLS